MDKPRQVQDSLLNRQGPQSAVQCSAVRRRTHYKFPFFPFTSSLPLLSLSLTHSTRSLFLFLFSCSNGILDLNWCHCFCFLPFFQPSLVSLCSLLVAPHRTWARSFPGWPTYIYKMCPERDIDKIAKGWTIAMVYSKERLQRLNGWEHDQMEKAEREGKLVLETTCLFVHACVKHGQYQYVLFLFLFFLFISNFCMLGLDALTATPLAGCRTSSGESCMPSTASSCTRRR